MGGQRGVVSRPRTGGRIWQLVSYALCVVAVSAAADEPTTPRTPGQRFVTALSESLGIEEHPCSDPPPVAGAVEHICGRFRGGPVERLAHAEAMRLAELQVPVLDVRIQDGVPPYQLVDLPGLDPVPEQPGWLRWTYLIDEQRVIVWVAASRDDEEEHGADRSRSIVFTVEQLPGPFPEIFPALIPWEP